MTPTPSARHLHGVFYTTPLRGLSKTELTRFHGDASCQFALVENIREREIYADKQGRYWAVGPGGPGEEEVGPLMRVWHELEPCRLCGESGLERLLGSRQEWERSGKCFGTQHPGFFDRADTALGKEAMAMCAACPVRVKCRDYARDLQEIDGPVLAIMGGETQWDRERLRGTNRRF